MTSALRAPVFFQNALIKILVFCLCFNNTYASFFACIIAVARLCIFSSQTIQEHATVCPTVSNFPHPKSKTKICPNSILNDGTKFNIKSSIGNGGMASNGATANGDRRQQRNGVLERQKTIRYSTRARQNSKFENLETILKESLSKFKIRI